MIRSTSLIVTVAALALMSLAVAPTASADHNCFLEDVSWTGLGAEHINPAIQTADGVCDGYHGHYCREGKFIQ